MSTSQSEKKPARAEKAPVTPDTITVGVVTRPQGIAGEVRIKLHNPDSELLGVGRTLILRGKGGERKVKLLKVRPASDAVVVALEGVSDRDQAEALRGAEIVVPRADLPALEEGEFYACDVEGARAELASGELVGTVLEFLSYPTCDVLVVQDPTGKKHEFPLVDEVVERVDIAAKRVVLRTREGL